MGKKKERLNIKNIVFVCVFEEFLFFNFFVMY